MEATAHAPGYLGVRWQHPTVTIPDNSEFPVHSSFFLLNVTHVEDGNRHVSLYNTSDTSVNIPR